jgi:GWxTD domain-containing protein
MRTLLWVLVALWMHGTMSQAYCAGPTPDHADSVRQVALEQSGGACLDDRIRALRQQVIQSPDSASVHCELGRLYGQRHTQEGRDLARKAFRNAIRLDPGNVEYALAYAQVQLAQGYTDNAEREFKKVAETFPRSAEAAYWAGCLALERVLELGGPGVAYRRSGEYFREDLARALGCLRRSADLDPDYRPAYYRLGLAFYETAQPDCLIQVANRMLTRYPNDKDAMLFSGIGHLMKGKVTPANDAFNRALAQMGPEERAMMESVDLIRNETGVDQGSRAAVTTGGEAEETAWGDSPGGVRFWRERDPLFLTAHNERRMEHYSRVAYANMRFSNGSEGLQGWQTHRGRAFIRFGRPVHRIARDARIAKYGYVREYHPKSVDWRYEGFSIRFESYPLSEWRLARGGALPKVASIASGAAPGAPLSGYFKRIVRGRGEFGRPASREAFRESGPRYLDPYRLAKYTVPHQVSAFREGDSIRVELSYALPRNRLVRTVSADTVHVEDGFFLFGEGWDEVHRDLKGGGLELPEPRPATQTVADSLHGSHLLVTKEATVRPGRYHAIVETWSRDTGAIGTFREFRDFSFTDSTLAISDLLLARHIAEQKPFPETRRDLSVTPNPLRVCQRQEPVFVYFEIYNLTKDSFGRTEYEVSFTVGPPSGDVDPSLFAAGGAPDGPGVIQIERSEDEGTEPAVGDTVEITEPPQYRVTYKLPEWNQVSEMPAEGTGAGGQTETAVTVRYVGDRETDLTYLQIDLAHLTRGIHKLSVKVRDVKTGETDEREAVFRVTN